MELCHFDAVRVARTLMHGLRQLSAYQQLLLLVAVTSLVRFAFIHTGLGIDESYAVATSQDFHLSGYDHPPMAWWLSTLMQKLFHSTDPSIVRLPFILLSAVATWQMFRLSSLLFSEKAGLYAALAFSCAPALGVTTGSWVLPDGPLLLGLLGGTLCLAHVFLDSKPDGRYWLAAGFWGGIALLSKYHGIFFFFGAFAFVISSKRQWHWLRSPWPYLGALIGIAVFSPVVVWNIEHQFASFAFQGGRTGEAHLHILKPLQMLLGQALFLTPWIWLALVIALREAMKGGISDSKRWFLLCLGVPQIVLFTFISAIASSTMLYHWAMPGYMLLLPLLGDWLARRALTHRRAVTCWVVASCSIIATLIAAVLFLWYAPALTQQWGVPRDPLGEMRPLNEINEYLANHKQLASPDVIVAPTKWHSAGQFDIALHRTRQVTCFCQDAREYGILAPLSAMTGRNFIIPVPLKNAATMGQAIAPSFEHLQRLDDLTIHQGGSTVQSFAMYFGESLKLGVLAP